MLEDMGHHVSVLSTRMPPKGLIAHDWSQEAIERTTYLGKLNAVAAACALSLMIRRELTGWILREGAGFAKDVLITLSAAWKLRAHCAREGLTHVHVHSCGRAALVAAMCHAMGGPTYSITLHGPLSDYGTGQRVKWSNAAFATVITEKLNGEIAGLLSGSLPPRIVVRPMGVDTDDLRRDAAYRPVSRGQPLQIFSCGRLNVVKGHQDLMRAIRLLLDAGVDVRLNIAGEDDDGGNGYRKVLESLQKELHLQDHVKILGAIDAQAVRDHLLQAHAFVLASWHEPLGVAYMEAMSCEVPTIGTDSGGVRELIEDGVTGLLVPPKDPEGLAAAIRRLVGDPDLANRLSAAGRAHVEAGFRAALGAETLAEEIRKLTPSAAEQV